MSRKSNEQAAVLAFVAGAVVAAGAALLLTPSTGREVRERLNSAKLDALDKLKSCVNKGKRGKGEGMDYDGGDCWI